MTIPANAQPSTWFQTQWNARLSHIFQNKGYMTRGMTMPPERIDGDKMMFLLMGKGEAQKYGGKGDEVKTMGLVKGETSLTSEEFDAADYIYAEDLEKQSASSKDKYQEAGAMALGRQFDRILFDKLEKIPLPAGQIIGSYADPLKIDTIIEASRLLFDADVPTEQYPTFCPLHPIAFDTMMTFDVFANADYIGPNLAWTQKSHQRTWQDVHFVKQPKHLQKFNRDVNGVNEPAKGRFWMWNQAAIGSGHIGEEIRPTQWQYELKYKRWYFQTSIKGGVEELQRPGIIEIRFKADSKPTFK